MALFNVLFDIAARTAKFEEAMTRVDRRLEGMQRTAGKVTKNLVGMFAVGSFARFITNMAQAGDEMLNLAQRTGRTVESVSQLSHVAERGNTTVAALTKAQDQLAKRLGATDEEGKAAAKALAELGLSGNRLRSLSLDEQLNVIADAMGSVSDPVKRARLEMALLGKAGTELDNVLRGGAGGIRDLRDEADRLGITISKLEAERLSKLDDQIENTKGQFKSLGMEAAALVSGPLSKLLSFLNQGVRGWGVMLGATNDRLEETNAQITEITMELNKLLDAQRHWDNSEATKERIAKLKEYREVLRRTQEEILNQASATARYEKADGENRARAAEAAEAAKKKAEEAAEAAKKAAEETAKWRAELDAIVELNRTFSDLELKFPTPLLSNDEVQRELERTGSMIREQAEEDEKVFEGLYQGMKDTFTQKWDEMSLAAEQGVRNIQDTLAEFLFDPFDKGLKGMLRGFIDVLRRMVAEAASAQILNALGLGGKGGGWLGSIFGGLFGGGGVGSAAASAGGSSFTTVGMPTFARGGYLGPGEVGIVGENGPEFAFGGNVGKSIVPQGGGPVYAPVNHFHIDSRADRAAVRQDMIAIAAEVNRAGLDEFRTITGRRGAVR